MKKKGNQAAPSELYVIGRREKQEFCWLVPAIAGEQADDQNLDAAEKFTSLTKAIAASTEYCVNVFEVVNKDGRTVLDEIMVDLDKIKAMPYEGCYELLDQLLAGPSFVCNHSNLTQERILRLSAARVDCIISLVSRGELFWERSQLDRLWFDDLFRHHHFPVADGSVPSRGMAVLILDTIDAAIEQGQKIFLRCVGSRGRTGTIACCFSARHGVATGEGVLNFLARRRYQFGLFRPSPETQIQREFVRSWKIGE
jgi:hypothetical protein